MTTFAPGLQRTSGEATRSSAPGHATGRRPVWQRFGRVLRQLALVGASVVVYYVMTTWLMERFGQRGLVYALLVLTAVMALWREFGSDLAAVPGRLRNALRRDPRPVVTAGAAPDTDTGGSRAPAPQPASRPEAEALFRQESQRLRDAEITHEEFQRFAQAYFFIDGQGKFWTIQADSEKWAYFKGGVWHPGVPLGTLTKAQMAR